MIEIPLQIIDLGDNNFHLLVEVVVYGQTFPLVLDTGASKTAFDHDTILGANVDAVLFESDKPSTGLGTNSMSSSTLNLREMYIGGLHIAETEVAVLDLSTIKDAYQQLNQPDVLGVLGSDLLMTHKAVIDYGKRTLYLSPLH